MIDVKALREFGGKANGGQWVMSSSLDGRRHTLLQGDCPIWSSQPHDLRPKNHLAIARFVCAANPQAVLTLLDALDLAREALEDIIVWLPDASVSGHLLKVEIDLGIAKAALERINKMMGDGEL